MKNQRRENGVSTTGRTNKRAKKDVQSKLKVVVKEEKVEEEQEHIGSKLRDSLVGEKEPDWALTHWKDRKSTRLNSSHSGESRMPSSA